MVCNVSFNLQVRVVDWMKGQTCGLCGKADGEVKQEYRTPNGRLTKNAVSYTHSWVLPAESCRDTTGETHSLWNYFYSNILFQKNVPPSVPTQMLYLCILLKQVFQTWNDALNTFSYRVPYEAWICAAGEAAKHPWPGNQMLLCWTCAALPAWLLPCEDHIRHCWLPLPACWWVCKKSQKVQETEYENVEKNTQFLIALLPSLVQILPWIALRVWAASTIPVWTWGKQQKPT